MSTSTLLAIAPLAYAAIGARPVRIHEPVQACAAGAPVVFLNAALLTMDSDTLTRGATVLVRDGRIAAINPSGVPSGAS